MWKYLIVGGRKKNPRWSEPRETDLAMFKNMVSNAKLDLDDLGKTLCDWSYDIREGINNETGIYPSEQEYKDKAMELAYFFMQFPGGATDKALMLLIAWHSTQAAQYYRSVMRGNPVGKEDTITW